jgi:hypothetical protein
VLDHKGINRTPMETPTFLPEDTILRILDGAYLLVHCQSPTAGHLFRASVTQSTTEGPDDFESNRVRPDPLHNPRPFRFRLLIPVRF